MVSAAAESQTGFAVHAALAQRDATHIRKTSPLNPPLTKYAAIPTNSNKLITYPNQTFLIIPRLAHQYCDILRTAGASHQGDKRANTEAAPSIQPSNQGSGSGKGRRAAVGGRLPTCLCGWADWKPGMR
jgi:hypothetical protein